MIATLTFKIHGPKRRVEARANEFMRKMATLMNKEIHGTTLVELNIKLARQSLPSLIREQNAQLPWNRKKK